VERYATISPDLHWLIQFMVNSFVRPSDIKNLQHKHVAVIRGEHAYLRLNLPESKKHDKPIVTLAPAARVYKRLVQLNRARGVDAGPKWRHHFHCKFNLRCEAAQSRRYKLMRL
jgi:hypothetical protein